MSSQFRKKLEKRLDKLMREFVIARDKKCVICGTDKGVLQCGHLISRKRKSIKYNLKNIACQCRDCNGRHRYYPQYYFNWFVKTYGKEELDRLVFLSNQTKHYTISELEDLEIALTEELKIVKEK